MTVKNKTSSNKKDYYLNVQLDNDMRLLKKNNFRNSQQYIWNYKGKIDRISATNQYDKTENIIFGYYILGIVIIGIILAFSGLSLTDDVAKLLGIICFGAILFLPFLKFLFGIYRNKAFLIFKRYPYGNFYFINKKVLKGK